MAITGDRKSVVKNISLVLDIEAEAKLQLNLSFDVRLQFADGVRVKEEIPAAAGAAAIAAGVGAAPPARAVNLRASSFTGRLPASTRFRFAW